MELNTKGGRGSIHNIPARLLCVCVCWQKTRQVRVAISFLYTGSHGIRYKEDRIPYKMAYKQPATWHVRIYRKNT